MRMIQVTGTVDNKTRMAIIVIAMLLLMLTTNKHLSPSVSLGNSYKQGNSCHLKVACLKHMCN